MYKYNRTDFIDTNLKEALTEAYSNHMTWINETVVQYERHRKRLEIVREEKERKRIELLGIYTYMYLASHMAQSQRSNNLCDCNVWTYNLNSGWKVLIYFCFDEVCAWKIC